MTAVELLVNKLSKTSCANVHDYVKLVNHVNVLKKCNLSSLSTSMIPTAVKNYNAGSTRRNKQLHDLIRPAYQMFVTLNATEIFTQYIIWWTYTVYNVKLITKYTIVDVVNDNLLNKFISWLTVYVNNLKILTEFNRSCKFITTKCKGRRLAEDVIVDLIASDTFAAAHMTGDISSYAIASIPDSVFAKCNFKKSLFSKHLLDTVRANRDYLLGNLNAACENIIKTPVNIITYINAIYRSK